MSDESKIRPRGAVIVSALIVVLLNVAMPLAAWAEDTGPVIGGEEYKRFDQYVTWSD